MRYKYLGDTLTDERLIGMQFDPVKDSRGKCIVSQKMATALVVDAQGTKYVVLRRRLRLNKDALTAAAQYMRLLREDERE